MLSPPRFPAGTMFCEAGAIKPIFLRGVPAINARRHRLRDRRVC
jgi:hypothetical protein